MLLGSLVARFLVEFSLFLGWKINEKSMKKVIDDKMDVGMDFGGLLGRFLKDFGPKLRGKLGSCWHRNLQNQGFKTMLKNVLQKKKKDEDDRKIAKYGTGSMGGGPGTRSTLPSPPHPPLGRASSASPPRVSDSSESQSINLNLNLQRIFRDSSMALENLSHAGSADLHGGTQVVKFYMDEPGIYMGELKSASS